MSAPGTEKHPGVQRVSGLAIHAEWLSDKSVNWSDYIFDSAPVLLRAHWMTQRPLFSSLGLSILFYKLEIEFDFSTSSNLVRIPISRDSNLQ